MEPPSPQDMDNLEIELLCSICLEIFMEPAVVTCGHLFCRRCIDSWSRRKKECPLCRKTIKNRVSISNGDTIVDKAVALMPKVVQERRSASKRERQEMVEPPVRTKRRRQDAAGGNRGANLHGHRQQAGGHPSGFRISRVVNNRYVGYRPRGSNQPGYRHLYPLNPPLHYHRMQLPQLPTASPEFHQHSQDQLEIFEHQNLWNGFY